MIVIANAATAVKKRVRHATPLFLILQMVLNTNIRKAAIRKLTPAHADAIRKLRSALM